MAASREAAPKQIEEEQILTVTRRQKNEALVTKLEFHFDDFKMKMISSHPRELTRENLDKWLEEFLKKIKKTTSRRQLDRIILAVERRQFRSDRMGRWTEVTFKDGKGRVVRENGDSEEWTISCFERKIIEASPDLVRKIDRSELKEETGEWKLDETLKTISTGGEAIVLEEEIGGLEVAVRVQCFDPELFTRELDGYDFEWNLSKGQFWNCFLKFI